MKIHPFALESMLSPEGCIRRLRATIAERGMGFFSLGDFGGSEQFFGQINGNSIELRKRKSWFWKNDFAPHLFATLAPTASGTRIEGHFGLSTWVSRFMIFWMSFVGIVGGIVAVSSLIQLAGGHRFSKSADAMFGVIFPLIMFAGGYLLPRICYYFSYWHERELLEFMKHTLAARET